MALRIINWDEGTARSELYKRLKFAKDHKRNKVEAQWESNERATFATQGDYSNDSNGLDEFESDVSFGSPDIANSSSKMGINYTFKNLRFIHAQLSANPPSVVARPTSSDASDRHKADAADRIIRYALRTYSLQEFVDKASLNCLIYGTGVLKTIWDSTKGDFLSVDRQTGEIEMEGDISITVPNMWNLFFDPDASSWEEVKYVFERIYMPYEEAVSRWPDKKEMLEKLRVKNEQSYSDSGYKSALRDEHYDVIELFEYWEKGLPFNGMLGRYTICSDTGELLEPLRENPFSFTPSSKTDMPATAYLPYHIMTDIDIPSQVWGKSFVSYEAPLQDILNRLDSVTLDNLQAHMVARIILPEGTEIADDAITNSPHDIIKIKGTQPPHYMSPMPWPAESVNFRDRIKVGIDDMAGVNEAMFGQQSRETSGFSMQYATNQGNMIRRRLFNKYVMLVESLYKAFLNLARKHWTIPRTIMVIGQEKAFEAVDIKGADIEGGFDLIVEYGASLSLDPMTRREEILTLMPIFEKAGVETKTILSLLKLNELESLYDLMQMAEDRQREIFEEMNAREIYIPPEDLQEHKGMLDYAYRYVMTSEFKYLETEKRELIKQHIRAREQLAAAGAAGVPSMPLPPGPLPQGVGGPLPAGPEMQAIQAEAPPLPVQ